MTHAQIDRSNGRRTPLPEAYVLKDLCRSDFADRVDRRVLLRAADDAGRALKLPCSAKALLGVLAAAYGEQQLSQGLMVWPSNAYLEAKTGLPERSLRRAIQRLREDGLVLMVDSPNGKRFARRNGNSVTQAFGFNLSPLYARREAFAQKVAEEVALALVCRTLRHDLNAVRKELQDIVTALIELSRHDLAQQHYDVFEATAAPRSKFVAAEQLRALLVSAEKGRELAERDFYMAYHPRKESATAGQNGRHKESNTEFSIEICKSSGASAPQSDSKPTAFGGNWAFGRKGGGGDSDNPQLSSDGNEDWRSHGACADAKSGAAEVLADVELWRAACPSLMDFGDVRTMTDVVRIGDVMSRLMQVAPHGQERWQKQLGRPLFQLVAVYVYQVYSEDAARPRPEIRKPGGFFCYVAKEVSEGARDLSVDLMALRRKKVRGPSAHAVRGNPGTHH